MNISRLTTDGRVKADPRWMPGKNRVAFSIQESPTLLALASVPEQGGSSERLHPRATTSEFELCWNGDGSRLAFLQNRGNLNLKLVLLDASGKESIFDPGGGFAGVRHPAFLPDSGRLIFAQPAAGGQQVGSCDLAGQNHRLITSGPGICEHPAPWGGWIAFASSREGVFQLYTCREDGSQLRRLTRHPGSDTHPAWHPSGKWLAFCRRTEGRNQFFRIQLDSLAVQPLFLGEAFERIDHLAFTGNGTSLLFVGEKGGGQDIYRLDL